MKIVEFSNGKFAVQTGNFITGYKYLDKTQDYSWSGDSNIVRWCLFDTKEEVTEFAAKRSLKVVNSWKV
jgi:hypothetical protein